MSRPLAAALALSFGLAFAPAATADAQTAEGAAEGLVTIYSKHDVPTSIDRLEAAVEAAGATVFARVDHAAGAGSVDLELRPTTLLIFGNPNVGTLAMQEAQTMGVDLPMRVVAWEDESGQTSLSYTDPAVMAARHGIAADAPFIAKMTGALGKLTTKAAGD